MENLELENVARYFAQKYHNDHLIHAVVEFDDESKHLTAQYLFDREPEDEDVDDCEDFCGELIGAFPDVKTADTVCKKFDNQNMDFKSGLVVYSRR